MTPCYASILLLSPFYGGDCTAISDRDARAPVGTTVMESQALDACRALIPSWVVWASLLWPPLAIFAASSILAYVCARVALFRVTNISSNSWAERARATYPARRAISLAPGLTFGFAIPFLIDRENPLIPIPLTAVVVPCLLAAVLGTAVVSYALAARLGNPPFRWRPWFRASATSWLVSPGWLILMGVMLAMPDEIGIRAAIVTVVGLAAYAYPSVVGTLPLLCRLGLASPASPRLAAAADEASRKVGVKPVAVYEVDLLIANAFALLVPNQVVFTRRLLEILDDNQLVAVCCHEFAHLAEPKRVKLITLAGYFAVFPAAYAAIIYSRFEWNGILFLALFISLILRRLRVLRKRMEGVADAAASHHELDSGVYAAALERIYTASNVPAVLGSRGTHGHLYDRMLAAGITPTYPRPAPPSRPRQYAPLAAGLGVLLLFSFAFDRWSTKAAAGKHPTETAIMLRMAIGAAGPSALAQLADLRSSEGRIDQAAVLYQAAVDLSGSLLYRAKLAIALSALGRCDDALEEWTETEDLLQACSCGGRATRSAVSAAKSAVRNCSSTHT
jgi:Zn-dependent protease with chaperone function